MNTLREDINKLILRRLAEAGEPFSEGELCAHVGHRISQADYPAIMAALCDLESGGLVMRFARRTGTRWAITDAGKLEIFQ